MTGRRSITIRGDLDRRVLNLRAFLLAQGIDFDYTAAINLLAELGFDEVEKSGFNTRAVDLLGNQVALDEETREALPDRWEKWRGQGPWAGGRGTFGKAETEREPRPGRSIPPLRGKQKPVTGHCFRCRAKREMRDAQEVTFKNKRRGYRGFCSVCRAKMATFSV